MIAVTGGYLGLKIDPMKYPAAEQRGIYKKIVTPQAAGN